MVKIKSALISVFDKNGIDTIAKKLESLGVTIYSTGGTETYIKNLGIPVTRVEDITDYPSILGGRVKTLHPKVFGGILNRRDLDGDINDVNKYEIPNIDLVIVDLYPFETIVNTVTDDDCIIENIDIGGISLIRAAAKNFKHVLCVSSKVDYNELLEILDTNSGETNEDTRKRFALKAFKISSHYDTVIQQYFERDTQLSLRYGENPHQKGVFIGDFYSMFTKLHGKELSYNNLLDVDSAVNIMSEFKDSRPTFAILKHNNACGLSTRERLVDAYKCALEGDPTSAFGGVLIGNRCIDVDTATEINKLFCEVVIAPNFEKKALEILKTKKNRVILILKNETVNNEVIRTCLNGVLKQERDNITDNQTSFTISTVHKPSKTELVDLEFASKISKHTKSNTIVLAKNEQLIGSGTGQTSRVDALRHAIQKAKEFDFQLTGAVMASDAFFPFPDCVEIAQKSGITSVIQPGGSIKDKNSIEYCNNNNVSMVFTGTRHFKH